MIPGIMLPMCGRYTFTFDAKTLGQAFDLVPPGFRVERSYNLSPGKWVIVVRPDQDQLAADLAHWGLVPTWAKDPKAGPRPINARAEGIHDRMPVILAPGDQTAWLERENGKAAELLRPFSAEAMEAYPVGMAVGNPKNDGPELIEPIEA